YDYDAAYNRTSERTTNNADSAVTVNKTYGYNNRHQLTDITDQLDPTQNIGYTFDASGNQTSKTQNGVVTEFSFAARDHLRQVTQAGSTVGQFLYDSKGLRVEKPGDRAIERYTYDNQSLLTPMDAGITTTAKYDDCPDRLLSLTHEE